MANPAARRTIPLTKAQLQTAAGAELLALCQTVTADGSIQDAEVAALRSWLEQNRSTDLPSIEFLVETVEKILADGRIDEWERRGLHKALERVLPPDARRNAKAAREQVEARKFAAQADIERREARNDPRAFQDADRVGDDYDFMVAGVAYEGRSAIVDEFVNDGDLVFFFRDRANQYSRNAVEIRLVNGLMIGYVPEEQAKDIAPLLDAGHPYHAWVKKIIGYRMSIPVILAEVLRKETELSFALREGQMPDQTGGGSRTAKALTEVSSDRSTDFLTDAFPFLLRSDLEALNGRPAGLPEMESYVKACGEIGPALRNFLERRAVHHAIREAAISTTNDGVRNALGHVRAALANALAGPGDEAPRVRALIQTIDGLVGARNVPSSSAAPPTAASAPEQGSMESGSAKSGSRTRLVIGLVILAAIGVAVLLAVTRS